MKRTALSGALTLLALALPPWGIAQSTQPLSISVTDAQSTQAVSFATVEVIQQGLVVATGQAGEDGKVDFSQIAVGVEDPAQAPERVGDAFPNPSRGHASIPIWSSDAGVAEIAVWDVLGRREMYGKRALSRGSALIELDFGGVPAGRYFAEVRLPGGLREMRPITLLEDGTGVGAIDVRGAGVVDLPAAKTAGTSTIRVTKNGYLTGTYQVFMPRDPEIEVRMQPDPAGLTNSIGMEFVLVNAGSFVMGVEDGWAGPRPPHPVTLTRDFYMGRFEVTQDEYVAVTGSNPSTHQGDGRLPVESVRRRDAVAYANALSEMEGLEKCYKADATAAVDELYDCGGYRLPMEAEMEYAVRAGSDTLYPWGEDSTAHGEYAWSSTNSDLTTHAVGLKAPNAWGLFDTLGNVFEMPFEFYYNYQDYTEVELSVDPFIWKPSTSIILRGCAFNHAFGWWPGCSSASRGIGATGFRDPSAGFRLVRTLR